MFNETVSKNISNEVIAAALHCRTTNAISEVTFNSSHDFDKTRVLNTSKVQPVGIHPEDDTRAAVETQPGPSSVFMSSADVLSGNNAPPGRYATEDKRLFDETVSKNLSNQDHQRQAVSDPFPP